MDGTALLFKLKTLIHNPIYNKKKFIYYLQWKHYQFIISDFKALIRKFSKFPPRNLKSLSTFSMILIGHQQHRCDY